MARVVEVDEMRRWRNERWGSRPGRMKPPPWYWERLVGGRRRTEDVGLRGKAIWIVEGTEGAYVDYDKLRD